MPHGLPLAATNVGPVVKVETSRAHDRYGIGRPARDDTSAAGRRARSAAANEISSRYGHDAEVTHIERSPDGGHDAIVRIGTVTMRANVTTSGRWRNRHHTVDIDRNMLVGTATEVSAPAVANGGRSLGPVVRTAALAQGVHGRDVDDNALPPPVAAKYARLHRETTTAGIVYPTGQLAQSRG